MLICCILIRTVRLFVMVAEDYRNLFSYCDQILRGVVGEGRVDCIVVPVVAPLSSVENSYFTVVHPVCGSVVLRKLERS
jgi:hypothetical protein